MLDTKLIHSLPQLPSPVFTVYLDTNPANPRNQRHPSGARIWLKSRAKVIGARAPRAGQKEFRAQLRRVDEFLLARPGHERGLLIFAGPQAWQVLPLQVPVEDELHWGRPSLTQLLWLLDEHQPCGIVFVDRSGTRFFRYRLGEIEEQEAERFELDISQWRRKDLMPPSNPGNQKTRGSQRDVFEQRIEAQYAHFFRDAAERIRAWGERENLDPVFVAGPNEAVEPVWTELPLPFREKAGLVKGLPNRAGAAELLRRLEPEIESWKRRKELAQVNQILAAGNGKRPGNGPRAVTGMDETLSRVQEGAARELLVVRGMGGKLKQCEKCGWVDRSADGTCPVCGGKRSSVAFRAIFPDLARRHGVPVEIVAGEAAKKLREAGGLAAWLR